MTQTLTRSLSATAAIAAVLALGSTPAVAQEAAPTIQMPPVTAAPAVPETTAAPVTAPTTTSAAPAAPSAPAPTIVLPDVTTTSAPPPATTTTAQVETAPARTEATRSPAPRSASSASTRTAERASSTTPPAARAATAEAPARSVAPASAAPAEPPRASSANILNDAPTRPVAAQETPPPAAPAPRSDDGIPGEALAGLLAALGIGAVGYAALRSRRRRVENEDAYIADEPLMDESPAAEPIRDEDVAPRTAPVFGTPQHATPTTQWRYGFAPVRAGDADTHVIEREPMTMAPPVAPSPERARAATPSSLPTTADERTAVLDRMVDAAPDEANPFTSRKSRRKRARLLLQQREAEAQRSEPFDWRSYSPSTKPSTPAHPPLVTA